MAKNYNITENNAIAFANDRNIRYPRFQRKQTWDEKLNFKLCISIFKGYPIGVVIINAQGERESEYLLDGRQRRNALRLMKDNPKEVYIWAKKFVGFSPTESESELIDKFWKSMDVYLQKDASKDSLSDAEEERDEENIEGNELEEEARNAYDFKKQYSSLESLLNLILLSHPMKSGKTNLEKMYEFNGIIDISDLAYAEPKNGMYIINLVKLKKYIDEMIDDNLFDPNSFSEAISKRYKLEEAKRRKLKDYINQHWEYYFKSLKVIADINNVLSRATIGVINLINASVLDAQNIFSLVNASGTPLSAEELLSARPFWNYSIINPSSELLEYKKEMYRFLEIDIPEDTCRWDLCSTFLKRIDRNSFIFENDKNSFKTSISLSYKIISALIVNGISKVSVTSLEKASIDWNVDIERYIKEINFVISLIEDISFFKIMKSWNQTIMSLTSNTIAIEFCVLMYKLWNKLERPKKGSAQINEFNKKAVILCDRLFYEYCIRMWTGSSDSLIAAHLKENFNDRFTKISEKEWVDFIEEIDKGKYKGKNTTPKTLKPFIYYYYFLNEMTPTLKNNSTRYEIDHIVAQNLFVLDEDNQYKDNFLNFSLLPKGENIEKNDKKLNQIHDSWLITQIKKYSGLDDDDLEKLSDLTNLSLLDSRKNLYVETFKEKRNILLKNI